MNVGGSTSTGDLLVVLADSLHLRIIRGLRDVMRVNVAVLGNRDENVHAHFIPRRLPDRNFGLAPWDRAPDRVSLAGVECRRLTSLLAQAFRSRAATV
ncbi:hypothetical protein K7Z75_18305 [Mycobacterium avium subsp. hominissuis]|uniref:hypothetical protein n=1 Tax=Mycobacterium avium TaxID=1764 RepID=UPI00293A8B14|nr:hypothetical protein [Mycobacterium avium]MDV3305615.1 hypothetical protein [Mycobacterium avium subsp. hominissuis]